MKTVLPGVLALQLFFVFIAVAASESTEPDAQLKGTLLDASGAGVGGFVNSAAFCGVMFCGPFGPGAFAPL